MGRVVSGLWLNLFLGFLGFLNAFLLEAIALFCSRPAQVGRSEDWERIKKKIKATRKELKSQIINLRRDLEFFKKS